MNLLGYMDNATLRSHLQRAKAFVFAAEEDFGILPVEAQACGTPVIAFGRGGVAETVNPGETGVLFAEQSVESLVDAVRQFEKMSFTPAAIRRQAESSARRSSGSILPILSEGIARDGRLRWAFDAFEERKRGSRFQGSGRIISRLAGSHGNLPPASCHYFLFGSRPLLCA